MYIKCDKNEMRQQIIKLKLENDIINNLISDILKKHQITNIYDLKDNKMAMEESIIKLYNINELTQQEIATLLNTNTTRVSKIIRNNIE